MSTQAAQFVGSIPQNYDDGLGPHIFVPYAEDIAARVAKLSPTSVLELAGGTGIVTRRLRDVLPAECDLVATDLNPPMLEVAQAKFQSDERIRFEQADATDLDFDDASFDVVVCQFGVMFFPDKDRSYREVHRVLEPGGSYVFNVWDSVAANPFANLAHTTLEEYFPENPPGFYKIPFGYYDADEIERAVSAAGFDEIEIEQVPFRSKIISADLFARGLVFGNPLFAEITERGEDPDDVHATIKDVIEKNLGSEMPLRALVVQASKR